jgi:hypothetical protein
LGQRSIDQSRHAHANELSSTHTSWCSHSTCRHEPTHLLLLDVIVELLLLDVIVELLLLDVVVELCGWLS